MYKQTKVWDLTTKKSFEQDLSLVNDSQVLVQVNKVYLDCQLTNLEVIGTVKVAGKEFKKLEGKEVVFMQEKPKDVIQEFEVVQGKYCVKHLKGVLLHYALTCLMIKEFLEKNKAKNVLHVTENRDVANVVKDIVKGNLVSVCCRNSSQVINVFDFDLILVGKVGDLLSFNLELKENQVGLIYDDCTANLAKGKVFRKNVSEWFAGLSKIRKKQFVNYIERNSESLKFQVTKPEIDLIYEANVGDYLEISIQDLRVSKIINEINCFSSAGIKQILTSVNTSYEEQDSRPFSADSQEKSQKSHQSHPELTLIQDIINVECLKSPQHLLNSYEEPENEVKIIENFTSKLENTCSLSTDFSLSPENSYDFLNQLILKYRNQDVDRVVMQFDSVFEKDLRETIKYLRFLQDSSIFEGDLSENDLPHGFGSRYFSDGTVFRGFWKRGKAHGKGLMVSIDGTVYYGEWRKGNYHGYGSLVDEKGDVYEGFFKYGELNGFGIHKLKSGDSYQGYFIKGMRHGGGHLRSPTLSSYFCEYKLGQEMSKHKKMKPRHFHLNSCDIPTLSLTSWELSSELENLKESLVSVPEDMSGSDSDSYTSESLIEYA